MKINELRKSTRQPSNKSSVAKKIRQSLTRQRMKTFADIKYCADATPQSTASKSNRLLSNKKMVGGVKSSFYQNYRPAVSCAKPEEYFSVLPQHIRVDVLEQQLYGQLFCMSPVKSVNSKSEVNLAITESYEFVEMNNNSIHVSRVFRSQLTNSFKTASNREDMKNSKKFQAEAQNNKENYRNDEQKIASMLHTLKKNVQFSGIDTCKKHSIVKGIVEMEDILKAEEQFKGKYLSQESFGKYLHNRQLPNSIEAFKNI